MRALFSSHILSCLAHDLTNTGPFPYCRWDEWVPESRALKWTEANLAKQQQLKELHSQKKKPAKPAATATATSDRVAHGEGSSGGGSGGSGAAGGDQRGRKRASQSMDKVRNTNVFC